MKTRIAVQSLAATAASIGLFVAGMNMGAEIPKNWQGLPAIGLAFFAGLITTLGMARMTTAELSILKLSDWAFFFIFTSLMGGILLGWDYSFGFLMVYLAAIVASVSHLIVTIRIQDRDDGGHEQGTF